MHLDYQVVNKNGSTEFVNFEDAKVEADRLAREERAETRVWLGEYLIYTAKPE